MDRYWPNNDAKTVAMSLADAAQWALTAGVRRRLLFGVVCVTCSVIWTAIALAQETTSIKFDHNISIRDLPGGTEKRPPPGISSKDFSSLLLQQPIVVLDHATLEITAPDLGSSRSLMFRRLELLHGSRIVTNGINVEIDADLIVSDGGEIIAFLDDPSGKKNQAPEGQDGAPGLNAGTVVLEAALNRNDLLHIRLNGQNGQAGGPGAKGPTGASGTRGNDAADHLFDCAHGGGDGGAGSQGGNGGNGGNGGPGGSGGKLIIRGKLLEQRAQIDFVAPGGHGGAPGTPGIGGDGGAGGEGGNGSTYCHGGHGGARGIQGNFGLPGKKGSEGQAGSLTAD